MGDKIRKTLKNLLCTIPIALTTLATFLPMNEAKGQITKINHPSRKELDGKLRIEKPNAIYFGVQLGLQPIQGISTGYSRKITPRLGSYLFLSKGKYKAPFNFYIDDTEDSHINYFNISLGGMFHTKKDQTGSSSFITFGFSYNFLDKEHYIPGTIDEKTLKNLSFEGGVGGTLAEKIGCGFSLNSNIESKVYLEIPFGYHQPIPKKQYKISPFVSKRKTYTSPANFF